jgi:hypothetical protein
MESDAENKTTYMLKIPKNCKKSPTLRMAQASRYERKTSKAARARNLTGTI